MTIDLTGGIDPARELMFAERPDNPERRGAASFWACAHAGPDGRPRHRHRGGWPRWDAYGIRVNVAFPDGRTGFGR
jgi:hypothetical protein